MDRNLRNHETVLRESIKHFLTSYHNGNRDFSSIETIFFRLIQTMLDPPLEITWFYSAVTFHSAKSNPQSNTPLSRVVVAKDLLTLLISCSNLSCGSKKIALLAPVVYELYNVLYDCDNDVRVRMELEKLVERVVGYASMCVGVQDFDFGKGVDDCDGVPMCFEDLVRVWTAERGGGRCCAADDLRVFFPCMSDVMLTGMCLRYGVHELVGIVLCELFFLRMYSIFGSKKTCVDGALEGVRNQALLSMKGFRNWYFLDMLLKMLSEIKLPIDTLLSSEDEVILRKSLYDAVMLFDYSFYTGRWIQSFDSHFKKLAILWLLVADCAIRFSWNIADRARGISYLNALHESQLATELIKWASREEETLQQKARPDIVTPQSLMRWLFFLEDQGIRVFDSSTPITRAKAVTCLSNVDRALYFVSSADASRKRKEAMCSDLDESRVKQARLGSSESAPSSGDVGMHQTSEVMFDDDMDIIG